MAETHLRQSGTGFYDWFWNTTQTCQIVIIDDTAPTLQVQFYLNHYS